MGPNSCLRRLTQSLDNRDFNEAYNATRDLESWCAKGGFYPRPSAVLDALSNAVRRLYVSAVADAVAESGEQE